MQQAAEAKAKAGTEKRQLGFEMSEEPGSWRQDSRYTDGRDIRTIGNPGTSFELGDAVVAFALPSATAAAAAKKAKTK